MFGGDDEDEQAPPGGIFANFAAAMAGGGGGHWGGGQGGQHHPREYDEYMKAYSMAATDQKPRMHLNYGGKILMPPSALAKLTNLDLESPWTFQLRNPNNPAASTHVGVLEFVAREGTIHVPSWMFKALRITEGGVIRLTGAQLPKGKFVKLQAQSVMFLEISDPKAVLEQALRSFSVLTQGDMIEITYNSMVFELLILETKPDGAGISLLDTDLEVDFAPPKGYVEPKRKSPPPVETMASKLRIDVNSSTPGSSRPASSLGQNPSSSNAGGSGNTNTTGAGGGQGGGEWESFKGAGQTLAGRKTKGKGKSVRKIEDVDPSSKIERTDKPRMATNDTLNENKKVPAPLRLRPGSLFFGYPVVPYKGKETDEDSASAGVGAATPQPPRNPFASSGNTLSGQPPRPSASTPTPVPSASASALSSRPESAASGSWGGGGGNTLGGGGGNTLGGKGKGSVGKSGKRGGRQEEAEVIEIDSD